MDAITVKKADLLDILQTNRGSHATKVARAREVYRRKIVDELDRRLEEAKRGQDIDPGFLHQLPIPRDWTLEYDRAIQQVQWEVNDTVELSPGDFNRFVRDEWEWRPQFAASTQMYLVE